MSSSSENKKILQDSIKKSMDVIGTELDFIQKTVKAFHEAHPDISADEAIYNEIKLLDNLALSRAYIEDTLNGLDTFVNGPGRNNNPDYAKTTTKKIRKALGYTF